MCADGVRVLDLVELAAFGKFGFINAVFVKATTTTMRLKVYSK